MNSIGSKKCAPVAIFVYKRKDHVKKVIEALAKNIGAEATDVYVFSDGSKGAGDSSGVNEVREYLESVSNKLFLSFNVIKRNENVGLADNIADGITTIVRKYGEIIVLEDDIITSESFLLYMNKSLEKYRSNNKVMQISGYSYPMEQSDLPETYFLPNGTSWGWGTWERAWNCFRRNPDRMIKEITVEQKRLLTINWLCMDNWKQVVRNRNNEIRTWSIFWDYCIIKNKGLVLYCRESYVLNIGFDGTGTNSGMSNVYKTDIKGKVDSIDFPTDVCIDKKAWIYLKKYFRSIYGGYINHIYMYFFHYIKMIIKSFLR